MIICRVLALQIQEIVEEIKEGEVFTELDAHMATRGLFEYYLFIIAQHPLERYIHQTDKGVKVYQVSDAEFAAQLERSQRVG